MRLLLYVFIGGGLGSVCRYGVGKLWSSSIFPVGTLMANIISCIILGILIGINAEDILKTEQKVLLMTGFCGGFSTFSTFSAELVQLVQDGASFSAISYLLLSLISGILSILAGIYLSRLILT